MWKGRYNGVWVGSEVQKCNNKGSYKWGHGKCLRDDLGMEVWTYKIGPGIRIGVWSWVLHEVVTMRENGENAPYKLPLLQCQIDALGAFSAAYHSNGASPVVQAALHPLLISLYLYEHVDGHRFANPSQCFNTLFSWGHSGDFKALNIITQGFAAHVFIARSAIVIELLCVQGTGGNVIRWVLINSQVWHVTHVFLQHVRHMEMAAVSWGSHPYGKHDYKLGLTLLSCTQSAGGASVYIYRSPALEDIQVCKGVQAFKRYQMYLWK